MIGGPVKAAPTLRARSPLARIPTTATNGGVSTLTLRRR
jgi:hypothetical protein